MTLVAAWIRVNPGGQELIVASDSRLTGGIAMDHAPKIFRLERSDAVLAYCGPTILAYPILLQLKSSLDGHEETRSRVVDLVHLKSHLEKVITSLRSKVSDLPAGDGTHRAFKFLLAGYSWKTSAFRIWTFRFDVNTGEFNAYSTRPSGDFIFMSDREENEYAATGLLVRKIKSTPGRHLKRLDWEPMSVLVQMIYDSNIPDIGGPPQVVKIYKHANTLPLNVLWPTEVVRYGVATRNFEVTHLGRPLLGYERSRYLTLDPETFELIEPWNMAARISLRALEDEGRVARTLRRRVALAISAIRDCRARKEVVDVLVKEGATNSRIQRAVGQMQTRPFDDWSLNL